MNRKVTSYFSSKICYPSLNEIFKTYQSSLHSFFPNISTTILNSRCRHSFSTIGTARETGKTEAGGWFLLLDKIFFCSAENFKGFNPNEIVTSRSGRCQRSLSGCAYWNEKTESPLGRTTPFLKEAH